MREHTNRSSKPPPGDIEGALQALSAEDLRALVRDVLLELDERTYGRVVNSLIHRAVRSGSGWAPAAIPGEDVSEIRAFAEAAKQAGYADPSKVDGYLRRGSSAFLRKDYAAASEIFSLLLGPIGEGEIDLGQHETVDEVLSVDVHDCAIQYVVSAYMISPAEKRAEAVRSAIGESRGLRYFLEPLQEMEKTALEPLPRLEDFLPRWRALLEEETRSAREGRWNFENDTWLREVVFRMEGVEGLGKLARSTRRAGDLRAWCRSLVEAGDWKAALAAFEEAAEIVAGEEYDRGEFLDRAALAAEKLGLKDLPARFERAWRSGPSMLRLRRWLGAARGKETVRKWAAEALVACPKEAHRQRAFLHVLLGDFEAAAKLLASAPGLGWSQSEHPGHLLFPLFRFLLGDTSVALLPSEWRLPGGGTEAKGLESEAEDFDDLLRTAPEIERILEEADIGGVTDQDTRKTIIEAMRKAAERRLEGVTREKRRRHYGHAASLVAACAAIDPSQATARWVAYIRDQYRRYPALRAELDDQLESR